MHYFNQALETMRRERLQEFQLEKAVNMFSLLFGHNRFYTRKWNEAGLLPTDIQSMSDLSKLPFTTKAELVQAQEDAPLSLNATFPEAAYTRYHQTSGTTGEPLRVLDTREAGNGGANVGATS